jgi:hypothetical protein
MATAYKVLGMTGAAGATGNGAQQLSAANTNYNLYTVPGSGTLSAVVSTITICNQASTAATFNILVRPAGATADTRHYIAYGTPIAGNDTIALTLGITLATTDIVTINASATTLSFAAFGAENS